MAVRPDSTPTKQPPGPGADNGPSTSDGWTLWVESGTLHRDRLFRRPVEEDADAAADAQTTLAMPPFHDPAPWEDRTPTAPLPIVTVPRPAVDERDEPHPLTPALPWQRPAESRPTPTIEATLKFRRSSSSATELPVPSLLIPVPPRAGEPSAPSTGEFPHQIALRRADVDDRHGDTVNTRWMLATLIGAVCIALGFLAGIGITINEQHHSAQQYAAAREAAERATAERSQLAAERADLANQLSKVEQRASQLARKQQGLTAARNYGLIELDDTGAGQPVLTGVTPATTERTAPALPEALRQVLSATVQRSTAPDGGVYFATCDAVIEAGSAPLRVGQPGYRPGLDPDQDGVACVW